MEETILHCDLNCFYASVEMLFNPELRKVPMAVGGDVEARHGIILTKNSLAKRAGVSTGEPLWKSYQKCPELVIVPPRFKLYLEFSNKVMNIYREYTDKIESFGIDEAWLDVSASLRLYPSPVHIANEIIQRVHSELGLTLSIGVSDNKIFSKLGSDLAGTQEMVLIKRESLHETIYPLPVNKLLFIGSQTTKKLYELGVHTIGDLAECTDEYLTRRFGKWGRLMYQLSHGIDQVGVLNDYHGPAIKSIGNSITAVRDLHSWDDIKIIVYRLAESVADRLREQGFVARGVAVSVRDFQLSSQSKQRKLSHTIESSADIVTVALALIEELYDFEKPLRGIGIKVFQLVAHGDYQVFDLFSEVNDPKESQIDEALATIRRRFGPYSVGRAILSVDSHLSHFYPKSEHVIYPISYLKEGIK